MIGFGEEPLPGVVGSCLLDVSTHIGEKDHFSHASFIRALILMIYHLSKNLLPNSITLGIKDSTYECWDNRSIQSITRRVFSRWAGSFRLELILKIAPF